MANESTAKPRVGLLMGDPCGMYAQPRIRYHRHNRSRFRYRDNKEFRWREE